MNVLLYMPELRVLHVDDNWLMSLRADISGLEQLRDFRLAGNPFRCDCHTLWMKEWLLTRQVSRYEERNEATEERKEEGGREEGRKK